MTMTRWKLTVEYNGADYHGWQRQESRLPTVQQAIEHAFEKFCQQKVTLHVAGRTDAGVHARGQIAHADLDYGDKELNGFALMKALNAHLRPQPISILKAEIAPLDFHARFTAKHKLYHYRIINRPSFLALDQKTAWLVLKDLNIEAMRAAAKHLIGTHDFSSFRASECQSKTPIKTLDSITITENPADHVGGKEIVFAIEGRSFLHHQVRNIVGTLKLVGEEKLLPDDVKTILETRDRAVAGPTAPPGGLFLIRVNY